MAFNYSVEIRDTDDNLVDIVENDLKDINWRYDALGGCGESQATLRRDFDTYGNIDLDYDVQIWRSEDPFGSPGTRLPAQLPFKLGAAFSASRELRWSGFIREISPILDEIETVALSLSGYARQLQYIMVPAATYSNMDVSEIVTDIIDTYVTPVSRIKHSDDLQLIKNTSVRITTLGFDASAFEIISALADIGGNAEWGVRSDREFYFMPRTTAVKQTHEIGDRIKFYQASKSTDEIVTRVYLRGAGGLTATLNNTAYSGTLQKERIVFVSSISTASDALLWGMAYFAKNGTPQPKGTLKLAAVDYWIENQAGEAMPPIGRLRVHGSPQFISSGVVGDQFGASGILFPIKLSGIYYGSIDEHFRVDSVYYHPSEADLEIEIALGEKRNSLSDALRSIEFRLGELRQGLTSL